MQAIFKKATRHLAESDIVASNIPPFGTFGPADALTEFYARLKAHQAGEGVAVDGGFAFGGMFADLGRGLTPKDYDLYVASPGMVDAIKHYLDRGGLDEYSNEDEWADEALGDLFPIAPHAYDLRLMHSDLLGDYFEFNGAAKVGGVHHKIDIKIGTKNTSPAEFITFFSAPIMAAAMTLGEEQPRFVYHRDCADHAIRGLLCTDRPNSLDLIEKAKRKNLEIITPAALAARDAAPEKSSRPDAARDPGYELHI